MEKRVEYSHMVKKSASAMFLMIVAALLIAFSLTACGGAGTEGSGNEKESPAPEEEQEASGNGNGENASGDAKGGEALVVYFTSAGSADFAEDVDADSSASLNRVDGKLVGNAGLMADYISEATGAKTWEIKVKKKYPGDYDKIVSQAKTEQEKDARPELDGKIKDFDKYKVFYLVFPNWWYDMPMALYTFFDEYDFSGKTINVFVTHGGSGFSDTVGTIKELEPKATVTEAVDAYMSEVEDSKDAVTDWVKKN